MFWDNVAWIYDVFANVNKKANRKLCAVVAGCITSSDEVLECACGTGLLSGAIAKRCRHLTATDFSSNMLKRAEQKYRACGNITFEFGNILNLDYPDECFDTVVAANVIHLLSDPYKALRVSGAIGKAGAGFQREFTLASYQAFFTDAGYPDADYTLCEGRIPCAVAVLRKSCKEQLSKTPFTHQSERPAHPAPG